MALTEPAARAPRRSAWALASSRLMVSRLPVKTIVLPLHSVSRAWLTKGAGGGEREEGGDFLAIMGFVEEIVGLPRRPLGRRPRPMRVRRSPLSPLAAVFQRIDGAEAFEQVAGGDDADVADAEAEQQAGAVEPLARGDRRQQRVDAFLLPSFAAEQVCAVVPARRKMSEGFSIQRRSANSTMVFSPSPSMSIAPRLTKCLRRSSRWAGQTRPPVRRMSTSPSAATASEPQAGQWLGIVEGGAILLRGEVLNHLRDDVAGALDSDAVASRVRPSRAISSRLWRVTLLQRIAPADADRG